MSALLSSAFIARLKVWPSVFFSKCVLRESSHDRTTVRQHCRGRSALGFRGQVKEVQLMQVGWVAPDYWHCGHGHPDWISSG
jgi:hypothetical protein